MYLSGVRILRLHPERGRPAIERLPSDMQALFQIHWLATKTSSNSQRKYIQLKGERSITPRQTLRYFLCVLSYIGKRQYHPPLLQTHINPFVHPYIHNLKLQVLDGCFAYQITALLSETFLVGLELHETGELQPQTHICCSLIQHCVHMLQAISYSHGYLVYNYAWQHNSAYDCTTWL